jgi:phenylpropionate dioxygenase-like ring-hydroxylating dioxygenase large terminal subunit
MSGPNVALANRAPPSLLRKRPAYPFSNYPNSWYAMAYSHEIGRGESKSVHFLGRDLVLFRGEDGKLNGIDAICPHLGAHLGGGEVVGNTMQCPFHGWRFDGNGACVAIPYADRVPSIARVGHWEVREENGQVLVWFHADGAAPTFEVPHLEGYGDRGWTKPRFHTIAVRTHVQEMNENVFDLAHFVTVHHFRELPAAEIQLDGAHARVFLDGVAALPSRPHARTRTENIMHGAGVTAIRVRTDIGFGPVKVPLEFMVVVGKTPIDEEYVEHRSAIVFRRGLSPLNFVLHPMVWRQVILDVEQDSRIWANKSFLAKPILVKHEATIHQFRKWHSQFYGAA